MPDYKAMYLHMIRESERAMNILIDAQCACEEIFINSPDPEIILLEQEEKDEPE